MEDSCEFSAHRRGAYCNWFVDSSDYMESVADSILLATREIFISAWFLGPQVYLKRPCTLESDWRLDRLLHRKALEGVKIYILLYKEIDFVTPLKSAHTKRHLTKLHDNIKVCRHSAHYLNLPGLWAHHEKLVIVDQNIAYFGGTDLCYGRWDNCLHMLTDMTEPRSTQLLNYEMSSTENSSQANLIDILLGAKIKANATAQEQNIPKLWFGIDFFNQLLGDLKNVKKPLEESMRKPKAVRMPWHDIAGCVCGPAARDFALHFVQRWNYIQRKRRLMCCSEIRICSPISCFRKTRDRELTVRDHFGEYTIPRHIFKSSFVCNVRVLRSACRWSSGVPKTDHSIYDAMLHLIRTSEHYIYIENQFFITSSHAHTTENKCPIHNQIGQALYERIMRAHSENQAFKVYVMMPLVPGGYSGEYGKKLYSRSPVSLHNLTSLNNTSIRSLIHRLFHSNVMASDYIQFFGLRTWSELDGQLVTEIVYVHSKLLIVDDRACIIGSANLNDRSLTGVRDSEIALYIEDTLFTKGLMNKKPCQVGVFSSSLRMRLYKEFLGAFSDTSITVSDPFCDNLGQQALRNTQIYTSVFRAIPSADVHDFKELRKYRQFPKGLASTDVHQARYELEQVKGFIVNYPYNFLCRQDLTPKFGTPEFCLPNCVWT